MDQLNVFGEPLPICCENPMTGFTRSGSCETMDQDHGIHTVCAHMTDEFLAFSKAQGNDLSTPQIGFPGLKQGDRWCLCAPRWKQAFADGMAPLIDLEATEESTLKIIDMETLKNFSHNKK